MARRLDLDLKGLNCPLPVLQAAKALISLSPGDLLGLTATDPMAAIDIPNLMRETGDAIELSSSEGELLVFHIRKAAA